ncbi:hypothetical protein M9458_057604, partial [Cirrhinus mrigala]
QGQTSENRYRTDKTESKPGTAVGEMTMNVIQGGKENRYSNRQIIVQTWSKQSMKRQDKGIIQD